MSWQFLAYNGPAALIASVSTLLVLQMGSWAPSSNTSPVSPSHCLSSTKKKWPDSPGYGLMGYRTVHWNAERWIKTTWWLRFNHAKCSNTICQWTSGNLASILRKLPKVTKCRSLAAQWPIDTQPNAYSVPRIPSYNRWYSVSRTVSPTKMKGIFRLHPKRSSCA